MRPRPSHRTARSAATLTTMLAVLTAVLSSPAHAVPAGTTKSLRPPYSAGTDHSTWDSGGGTSVCRAASWTDLTGTMQMLAELEPAPGSVVAFGRAHGEGRLVTSHRLTKPAAAVRYTFQFSNLEAAALVNQHPDLMAQASVGGIASLPGCAGCGAIVEKVLADSDPLTVATDTLFRGAASVVVELRNPTGEPLPAGTVTLRPFGSADLTPRLDWPFASWGRAQVLGTAASIDVEVLLA